MGKQYYSVDKAEFSSPCAWIKPLIQIRYWNGESLSDENDWSQFPLDTVLVEEFQTTYINSKFDSVFSKCPCNAQIVLDQDELYKTYAMIARKLSKMYTQKYRFDRLIHDYRSLNKLSQKNDSSNIFFSEERILFVFLGSVYNERASDSSVKGLKTSRTLENLGGKNDIVYPPEDVFPFYELCLGVFNFKSDKIEYLYRDQSFSIDLKNESQYRSLLVDGIVRNIPTAR